MADLGEGTGLPGPPLFWVRKEEIIEGRKASRATKSSPPPVWIRHAKTIRLFTLGFFA